MVKDCRWRKVWLKIILEYDTPQPLIIGGRPPILNQMQSIKMIRKIDRICALLKGLEYLLRFSPKGIINKTPGK